MSASPAPLVTDPHENLHAFSVANLTVAARKLLALAAAEKIDGIEIAHALDRFSHACLGIRGLVTSAIDGTIEEAIARHQAALILINRTESARGESHAAMLLTRALAQKDRTGSRMLAEAAAAAGNAYHEAMQGLSCGADRQAQHWHQVAIGRLEAELRFRSRKAA